MTDRNIMAAILRRLTPPDAPRLLFGVIVACLLSTYAAFGVPSHALATAGGDTLLLSASVAFAWLVDRGARRKNDLRLRFMARHDLLTSLPNRLLFEEISKRELTELAAARRTAAVLCLDLDGFKEVNDIFGHAAGDAVLIEVARRLQSLLGDRCLAARLGGDEFAVLATGLGRGKTAGTAAQGVIDILAAPYDIEGSLVDIGCSVGVAAFPADGTAYAQLMTRADVALARAKAEGRGVFRFFEASMDETLRKRRHLARDLRAAVGTAQFRLVYQPQCDLQTGHISTFEALARWDHPKIGIVSPATFIPIAEETGVILPLGEWVLRAACGEAATWREPLTVAVNVSVAQFRQSGFLETIVAALRDTGLPPHRLELEVTEGIFLDMLPRTFQVLEGLKQMAVRITIDNFGAGSTSLPTLQAFAFDKIKIDRSFTSQIGRTAKGTAMVEAVIGLGDVLGTSVVVEGVETNEQMEALRRQNARHAQGYLFGKPMPIERYADVVDPGLQPHERRVA